MNVFEERKKKEAISADVHLFIAPFGPLAKFHPHPDDSTRRNKKMDVRRYGFLFLSLVYRDTKVTVIEDQPRMNE
jgi:hypothetical protein